ncbi:uncharacterized protein A1O9_00421 [Exophiala aquamarina CBS 119918]|uniref:Prenylcysteine lyase domain-containing protein n=1 Tax=Exophiala aquamarina CBS 119918 TaxID=1182545 RepID=A0A072PQR4_9EURO|nr:uncharacterized protein A1O9_00421 [Exophiala aquamarina CBS 119918]KEF62449.1 hypothetical protein A1O9_00421 [Exophiala aquamarina CBS 119918]
MHSIVYLSVLLLSCLSITLADDLQSPLHDTQPKAKRIAIIGAGAGGSSTSYFLTRFAESSQHDIPLEITVFDSNTYIGGRTTTVDAFDDESYPVELGASIFVKVNHILYNATRDFGLSTAAKIYEAVEDSKYDLGIWDGTTFVYKAENDDDDDDDDDGNRASWRGWWDIAKLLWKYGWAPIRTQRTTKDAVGKFLEFYHEPWFPFTSLQEVVHRSGLVRYTNTSGSELLKDVGVGELFTREIIQAATRVNYASNLGSIHGLETLVCMAIEGAVAVDGGNWQIFAEMVKTSAHKIWLNTTVTDIVKDTAKGTFNVRTSNVVVHEQFNDEYDAVILAAPYQFAEITFSPLLAYPPKEIPYNTKYVTLFTSPRRLSPSFFGLESQSEVPSSILTTLTKDLNDKLGSQRGRQAVGPTGFWSISTLRTLVTNPISSEPQYLYKIFSAAPLTAGFLAQLFDIPYTPTTTTSSSHKTLPAKDDPISMLPRSVITWSYEKTWAAYPYETPTATFENFSLPFVDHPDSHDGSSGLWYTSGIESFISTMETSALAGRNVARLIVDRLEAEVRREMARAPKEL